MTLYDSSVLIDYLDGDSASVEYVEARMDERAVAPPLGLFKVDQGEVFEPGEAEFDAVDAALGWVTVVEADATLARAAAELRSTPHERGAALAPRDAFAGAAAALDERLAVGDADFDLDGLTEVVDVDFVWATRAAPAAIRRRTTGTRAPRPWPRFHGGTWQPAPPPRGGRGR